MRQRAALLTLAVAATAAAAVPAPAAAARRTSTALKIKAPTPANATVAGFKLSLVRARTARVALAHQAAGLPKNVSVYAVVAKQKRSDQVKGVVVAVNRADVVAAAAQSRAAARTFTIRLRHEAVPKGFRLSLNLNQRADVLDQHRVFRCSKYFRQSDLSGAQKLAGPGLPGITIGTAMQSACSSARSGKPYPAESQFRYSLNARSGVMAFTQSTQAPNEVNGTATFNYGVRAFGVVADRGHQFTNCAFTAGTCAISSTAGPNDYALFTLGAPPAPPGTPLGFALAISPQVTPALPFQFFGMNATGARFGPLLTSGP